MFCWPPLEVATSIPPLEPNAPNRTLRNGRFIALPMRMVSIVPLAPTSVPAMISRLDRSSNPVIATASPVNELRSEMTTGMSAPPIGSTNSTPSASASATMTPYAHVGSTPSVTMTQAASPAMASAISPLTICCPRYVTGRPLMSS